MLSVVNHLSSAFLSPVSEAVASYIANQAEIRTNPVTSVVSTDLTKNENPSLELVTDRPQEEPQMDGISIIPPIVCNEPEDPIFPGGWPEDEDGQSEMTGLSQHGLFAEEFMLERLSDLPWASSLGRRRRQRVFSPPRAPLPEITPGVCGICGEACQITENPIAASKIRFSFVNYGIALTCRGAHKYCLECMKTYVNTELDRGQTGDVVFPIRCPECSWGEWEMEDDIVEKILDTKPLERWHFQKLVEATDKYYCPNPLCSELLELPEGSGSKFTFTKCPSCRQTICIPCQTLGHEGMSCSKNQRAIRRSGKDGSVFKIARKKGWRRCPKCHVIVERISGCDHMTCKCRHSFCYRCGSDWTYVRCGNKWSCKLRLTGGTAFCATVFQKTKDIIIGPLDDSAASLSRLMNRVLNDDGKEDKHKSQPNGSGSNSASGSRKLLTGECPPPRR